MKTAHTTKSGVNLVRCQKKNLVVGDRVYLRFTYLGTVTEIANRKITLDTGKTLSATSQGANRFMKEVQA